MKLNWNMFGNHDDDDNDWRHLRSGGGGGGSYHFTNKQQLREENPLCQHFIIVINDDNGICDKDNLGSNVIITKTELLIDLWLINFLKFNRSHFYWFAKCWERAGLVICGAMWTIQIHELILFQLFSSSFSEKGNALKAALMRSLFECSQFRRQLASQARKPNFSFGKNTVFINFCLFNL